MEFKNSRIGKELFKKHIKEMEYLTRFIEKAAENLRHDLICVILTGSRARSDFNIGSDIDLIIIGNWKNKVLYDRIDEITENVEIPPLPIDFFIYTPSEIVELVKNGNPLILDGIYYGKCLYNRKYFAKLRKQLEELIDMGKIGRKGHLWYVKSETFGGNNT